MGTGSSLRSTQLADLRPADDARPGRRKSSPRAWQLRKLDTRVRQAKSLRHWKQIPGIVTDIRVPVSVLAVFIARICRSTVFGSPDTPVDKKVELLQGVGSALIARSSTIRDDPIRSKEAKHGIYILGETVLDALYRLNAPQKALGPAFQLIIRATKEFPKSVGTKATQAAMVHFTGHRLPAMSHALLAHIPNDRRTLDHYRACLALFGTRAHAEQALKNLDAIWTELVQSRRLQPDLDCFYRYLQVQAQTRRAHATLEPLRLMEQRGMLPDTTAEMLVARAHGESIGPAADLQGFPSGDNALAGLAGLSATDIEKLFSDASDSVSERLSRRQALSGTLQRVSVHASNITRVEVARNFIIRQFLRSSRRFVPASELFQILDEALKPLRHRAIGLTAFKLGRYPLYKLIIRMMRLRGTAQDVARLETEAATAKRLARLYSTALTRLGARAKMTDASWDYRLEPVEHFFQQAPSFTREHLRRLEKAVVDIPCQESDLLGKQAKENSLRVLQRSAAMAEDPPASRALTAAVDEKS